MALRTHLICALCFLALAACRGHSTAPADERAPQPKKELGPELVLDEREFDFGVLLEGDTKTHALTLKNQGDAPLTITEVSADCTCELVSLKDSTIAPHARTELEVRFHALGPTGPDHKTLLIHSNDPKRPQYALRFDVVILPSLHFEPSSAELASDDAKSRKQTLLLAGRVVERARLGIAEIKGESAALSRVRIEVSSPPYDSAHPPALVLALRPGSVGSGRGVVVVTTGVPDPVQLSVPFKWGTRAELARAQP